MLSRPGWIKFGHVTFINVIGNSAASLPKIMDISILFRKQISPFLAPWCLALNQGSDPPVTRMRICRAFVGARHRRNAMAISQHCKISNNENNVHLHASS